LRLRAWSGEEGRFISEDPARDGGNWFAYVANNPMRYVDPTGLFPVDYVAEMAQRAQSGDASAAEVVAAYTAPQDRPDVETAMAQWNASHSYTSESFLPGSTPTDTFGKVQGPYNVGTDKATGQVNWYQTTHHAGVDRVATQNGQSMVAPQYLKVVQAAGNRLTMNVVGTERNVSIIHLDPKDVAKMAVGQEFAPGDAMAPYPSQSFGTGTGVHVHIQESDVVGGTRTIVNPDTHQVVAGDTYRYRRGSSVDAASAVNWRGWTQFPAY
jgi:hypothetical protein